MMRSLDYGRRQVQGLDKLVNECDQNVGALAGPREKCGSAGTVAHIERHRQGHRDLPILFPAIYPSVDIGII